MARKSKKNKKNPTDADAVLVDSLTKATTLHEDVRKSGDPELQSRADAVLRKEGDNYLRQHSAGYARVAAEREAARLAA